MAILPAPGDSKTGDSVACLDYHFPPRKAVSELTPERVRA